VSETTGVNIANAAAASASACASVSTASVGISTPSPPRSLSVRDTGRVTTKRVQSCMNTSSGSSSGRCSDGAAAKKSKTSRKTALSLEDLKGNFYDECLQ
jgi:hypothetical protein